MATGPTRENAVTNDGLRSVHVTTSYHHYTPPFSVEPIVRRMLDSIPNKYLVGLSEVVLTNTLDMSRGRRRAMTKSRNRKVGMLDARGLYHPAWNNQPAWIEIFVENTLKYWENSWWLKLNFIREAKIADVLFHEIGHHIHFTIRPEHKEREDVADIWKVRLERHYNRTRRPFLRAIFLPIRPLMRVFSRSEEQRMFHERMISRAEYEERKNRRGNPL